MTSRARRISSSAPRRRRTPAASARDPLRGGFDDPYLGYPGGPSAPGSGNSRSRHACSRRTARLASVDPEYNSTRAQSWNVIVERQIGTVWQASASYLGSYTDRLWGQVQVNPGVFLGLGPCTLQGVFYPTCTTTANLNQRRKLSLENPVGIPPDRIDRAP